MSASRTTTADLRQAATGTPSDLLRIQARELREEAQKMIRTAEAKEVQAALLDGKAWIAYGEAGGRLPGFYDSIVSAMIAARGRWTWWEAEARGARVEHVSQDAA